MESLTEYDGEELGLSGMGVLNLPQLSSDRWAAPLSAPGEIGPVTDTPRVARSSPGSPATPQGVEALGGGVVKVPEDCGVSPPPPERPA